MIRLLDVPSDSSPSGRCQSRPGRQARADPRVGRRPWRGGRRASWRPRWPGQAGRLVRTSRCWGPGALEADVGPGGLADSAAPGVGPGGPGGPAGGGNGGATPPPQFGGAAAADGAPQQPGRDSAPENAPAGVAVPAQLPARVVSFDLGAPVIRSWRGRRGRLPRSAKPVAATRHVAPVARPGGDYAAPAGDVAPAEVEARFACQACPWPGIPPPAPPPPAASRRDGAVHCESDDTDSGHFIARQRLRLRGRREGARGREAEHLRGVEALGAGRRATGQPRRERARPIGAAGDLEAAASEMVESGPTVRRSRYALYVVRGLSGDCAQAQVDRCVALRSARAASPGQRSRHPPA